MGTLTDIVADVRLYMDDPATSAKFTTAQIVDEVRNSYGEILRELIAAGDNRIRVKHEIVITEDTAEYVLPPTVGEFLSFEKLDSDGNLEWEVTPRHPLNRSGAGFLIEGPMLYLDPTWPTGYTMTITYIPSGEIMPLEATGVFNATLTAGVVSAVSSLKTNTTPTIGELDWRPNAYAGYVMRILDAAGDWGAAGVITAGLVQERVISSSTLPTTGDFLTFNWAPTLSPLPGYTAGALDDAGVVTFEIVPVHMNLTRKVVATRTAMTLAAVVADLKREQSVGREYLRARRALRLTVANMEQRKGGRFHRGIRR